MSRLHVHIAVQDLMQSIDFYSTLFGSPPTKVESDYAKWQLDDPKVNFAISCRGETPGLNHLGLQAESAGELAAMEQRLSAAGFAGVAERGKACCYARSDKYWTVDPQGIAWESFHTLDSVPTFHGEAAGTAVQTACCTPAVGS